MKPKSILYIHRELGERKALGQSVRRQGLLDGLASQGFRVVTLEVPSGSAHLPELLAAPRATHLLAPLLNDRPDIEHVIIEGLPLALRNLWGLRKLRHLKAHVDVCDSWVLLSDILSPGDKLSSNWRTGLKKCLSAVALRSVSRFVTSMIYISEKDLSADARYLSRCAKPLIVPNTGPARAQLSRLDPNGPFVVVGDWQYPPNARMLKDTLSWLRDHGEDGGTALRIVGPNLRHPPKGRNIQHLGWVEDLADAYEGVCCALVFISEGAGMKNKVLDALSFGVPVAASRDALTGIDSETYLLRTIERPVSAAALRDWAAEVGSFREKIDMPTWSKAVAPLASALED